MTSLNRLSARELTAGYSNGSLSPVEATTAALDAIESLDSQVNAFVLVTAEAALEQAKESEARWRAGQALGPADGVPTSIKDIFLTRDLPTLRGTTLIDPTGPWSEDAPAVARLRSAGAVFLGKTTTPEFAWKGVTDSIRHGATGNPWDAGLTSGGSSGGSATAVGLGMGAWSVGTGGGGSVRIPAAFTGTVALKPTYGLVPMFPASPFGTLAHAGPITRTVTDAAALLDVIVGFDERDWSALPTPNRSSLTTWRQESEACGSLSRRTSASSTTTRRSSGWCAKRRASWLSWELTSRRSTPGSPTRWTPSTSCGSPGQPK